MMLAAARCEGEGERWWRRRMRGGEGERRLSAFYTTEARVEAPCDLQWMAMILGVRAEGTWWPSHGRVVGSGAGASRWRRGARGLSGAHRPLG
jgi:hypothetical protein